MRNGSFQPASQVSKVYQTRNKPGTAKLASHDDDVCTARYCT